MNKASGGDAKEYQLNYFKSKKMMLWKCCTQYPSTFGKLSSGHRTGKGQLSLQSQRKAMLKNPQTTTQLHSSHTRAKKCSKFSMLGFNTMWTENFQMFKLNLEKAEEPEIRSQEKQENSRKTSTSASLTTLKPLTVWITTNCGKFLKRLEHKTTLPASWETCMQVKKQVRTRHGTTDWFQIGKGVHQGCILPPCWFNLYAKYIMRNAGLDEVQAGIKIARRNINNIRYTDNTTLMAESEEELKSLLMKLKEESEIQYSKI